VGRMFIQPRVTDAQGQSLRLDDAIGARFALIAWGTDPAHGLDDRALAFWRRLDACLVRVMPPGQLGHCPPARDGVITLGDAQGRIKEWFGRQSRSIAFVRPDRFVAALASPQEVGAVTAELARLLYTHLAPPAAQRCAALQD